MAESKLGRGRGLSSQTKEVISNLIKFVTEEAENGEPIIDIKNIRERVLAMSGISQSSYTRVREETKKIETGESSAFKSPSKKKPRKSKVVDCLSAGEIGHVRRIIYDFHILEKRRPTVSGEYFLTRKFPSYLNLLIYNFYIFVSHFFWEICVHFVENSIGIHWK